MPKRALEVPTVTGLVFDATHLADVEAKLELPQLAEDDRGRLLLAKARLVRGRVPSSDVMEILHEAIAAFSSAGNMLLANEALAHVAADASLTGNLSLGLEQCLRVVSQPELTAIAKNAIGVVLHRVGAFDLAADIWSEVLTAPDCPQDANVIAGIVLNLLSAVSRLELTLGSANPQQQERLVRVAELALDRAARESTPAAVAEIVRLLRAHIAVLRGDLETASSSWGVADAIASHRAIIFRMYFVSIEIRIALYRGDLDRAQELVDFMLADHAEDETLRLAKVEASLRQSEILARRGDAVESVQAARRATQLALAERFGLPRLLVDEVGEKLSLQRSEVSLLDQVAELRNQLHIDILTGLGNRRALDERVSVLREGAEVVAVIVVDIDHFKEINDRYGHAAGDKVLVRVGNLLRSAADPGDTIVRPGGDEFMLLTQTSDIERAEGVAALVHQRIRDHDWASDGVDIGITCSVGVALGPSERVTDLLTTADRAMYQAKSAGRDCVVPAELVLDSASVLGSSRDERTALAEAMRNSACLSFAYQPVVPVGSGVPKFEALARWMPPRDGLPDSLPAFLAAVERLGLGDLLTELSLQHVASEVAALRRRAGSESRVAINLSSFQMSSSTISLVQAALASCAHENWLSVEVVESLNWGQLDDVASIVVQLQDLGVPVYLDDFGTGTTSFELMTEIGFDGVKIDARLITKLEESDLAQRVIGSYVATCNYAGIDVTAEGVETVELANQVRRLNFTHVQGHYYGRPQRIADMAENVDYGREDTQAETDLDPLRAEINAFEVDNLAPSLEARLAELDALESRLGSTPQAESLRALLFERRSLLTSFAGRTDLSVDFVNSAIQIAERCGDTATQLRGLLKLAHSGTHDPDLWSAGSEAFASAVELYRSRALDADDRASIEVVIGVVFSDLHLHDEGVRWWQRALRSATSKHCIHATNAAFNLAESLLTSVEGAYSRLSELSTSEAHTLATAMDYIAQAHIDDTAPRDSRHSIALALQVRYLLVLGDEVAASELWQHVCDATEPPTSYMHRFHVLRARSLLARACDTDEAFLAAAQEVVDLFEGTGAWYRHTKVNAIRLLAEAHERNQNRAAANDAFQVILDDRQQVERMRGDARLAWLEAHVDGSRMFRQ